MANTTLQLKKSGATGNVPPSLEFGELALNYADGKLYYKAANGTITYIQSGTSTDSFATINANSSLILATSPTDTLSILPGNNITISANTVGKSITINSTGGSGSSIDQYARDTANGANGLAQGAYDTANLKFNTSGGAITGNVSISNNLSVSNTITTNTLNISTETSNVSLTRGTGITSWNYSGITKSVAVEETSPTGIFVSPDGSNTYVCGTAGQDLNQYTLSIPWNISTASFVRTFSTLLDSSPQDIFFKPDGLTMYIAGQQNQGIIQYTLSSAWNISTAAYSGNFKSTSAQDVFPTGVWFKPDGTVMYVIGQQFFDVSQYSLPTPWNVATASYNGQLDITNQEASPHAVNLSDDGTKMWIIGAAGDDITEYSLSSPWNVTSASPGKSFYIGFQEIAPTGMFIAASNNRVYVVGQNNDTIYQYNTNTNSIAVTTDVLTVNNNARIEGNVSIYKSAYVDSSLTVVGSASIGTSLTVGSGGLTVSGLTSTSTLSAGTTTISGTLTGSSTLSLTGSTSSTTTLGTSATTGTTTIGGTSQTGIITFGRSTTNQTASIANGTTAAGATKVVHLGINGASGSTTRIFIGPDAAGANGNVMFHPTTTVAIQNTRVSTSTTTGALTVLGGVGVSGSIYADALYDGGVEVITYTQGVNNTQNTRLNSVETINTNQNTSISIIQGVDNTQNTNITAVNNFAQGAYNTANVGYNFVNSGGNISGDVIITANNDLTVTGNLIVLGNTFSVGTQTLEVVDPMIILANGNFFSDTVDIGFAGHYNNGSNAHTGFFRDFNTKDWYLFQGYTPELSGNNNVVISDPSFDTANLVAKKITANVSATTITISGRDQASVDSTQNSQITAVNQFAQAAYNQANNAGGGTTVTISDDNTSNNVYYVNFTANTSGNANTLYVSSNNLSFIPSTGTIGVKAINLTANTNISSNAISLPNDLNQATIDSFSTSIYRGAFYQVQMSGPAGIHILNLNITHDDTSVFANTFGDAYSTAPLGTFSGNIVGTTLNVLFTPTNALTTVAFIRNVIVKMGVETPAGSLGFVGDPVTVIYDAGFDSDPTTISFDYGTVP